MITIEELERIKINLQNDIAGRDDYSQEKWKALGAVELIDHILNNGIKSILPRNRKYEGTECIYWNYWGSTCDLTGRHCEDCSFDHCDQYEPAETEE